MPHPASLAALCFAVALAAAPAHAAPTPLALVGSVPEVAPLLACVAERLRAQGPEPLPADAPAVRMEFRVSLLPGAALAITGLLRPDVSALIAAQDDDPEAHPAAARRFFRLLRVHVGTRAWPWQPGQQADLCREAADWIHGLRSRPVLFDRLGPDGEAR